MPIKQDEVLSPDEMAEARKKAGGVTLELERKGFFSSRYRPGQHFGDILIIRCSRSAVRVKVIQLLQLDKRMEVRTYSLYPTKPTFIRK